MQELHDELLARTGEVEKLLRSLPVSSVKSAGGRSARGSTPARPSTASHNDSLSVATSAAALQRRWTTVSRMSAERNKKLLDMYNRLLEVMYRRHPAVRLVLYSLSSTAPLSPLQRDVRTFCWQ